MQGFLLVVVGCTLGGVVIALVGTLVFVVWPMRARIQALSVAAKGVGSTRFAAPEQPRDPLGDIADVLSQSHERIVQTQLALEQRNEALEHHLGDIAHDLRTPLASMQLSLESVVVETEGAARAASSRALSDVVYLSALVENLHQATRLRQDIEVAAGLVDLQELVQRIEQRFAIVGRNVGVEVAANTPEHPVWAACLPALAERAVANLVQNAVEHNDPGGHVAVVLSLTSGGTGFELVVADDGPGLPDAILATLASETFLTDEARRRSPGLGMLITREVAQRAGWALLYEPLSPRGLRVRLTGLTVSAP